MFKHAIALCFLLPSLALYSCNWDPSTFAFLSRPWIWRLWHNTKLLLICLVVLGNPTKDLKLNLINLAKDSKLNLILFVCLSRSKCRACEQAAKTTLLDLGYCDSALTSCICLFVCPLNSLDLPEYTPLKLPTSRLYKPDFFFCFRRLRAC